MQLMETWTDIYGCQHITFRKGFGGQSWVLGIPQQQLQQSTQLLSQLLDLLQHSNTSPSASMGKGEIHILCYSGLTPLQRTIEEFAPAGVVLLHEQTLSGGPAVTVPALTQLQRPDSVSYSEGGEYPAWGKQPDSADSHWQALAPASAVAALGCEVWVSNQNDLGPLLERLLTQQHTHISQTVTR